MQASAQPGQAGAGLAAEVGVDAEEAARLAAGGAAEVVGVLEQVVVDLAALASRAAGAEEGGCAGGVVGGREAEAREEVCADFGDLGRLDHPVLVVVVAVLRYRCGVGVVF